MRRQQDYRRDAFSLVWIDDTPGPKSLWGYVERNAIALLSNYQRPALDPTSNIAGQFCDRSVSASPGSGIPITSTSPDYRRFSRPFRSSGHRQTWKHQMIVVIQCAASNDSIAGHLHQFGGQPVLFVADPSKAPLIDNHLYARPDDLSEEGRASWRDLLRKYNSHANGNPFGLLRAFNLYENDSFTKG